MLDLKPGQKIRVGTGLVDIECLAELPADDGVVIRDFSVQFQCDDSPRFRVHIDRKGRAHYLQYSDDKGNTEIEENSYADEMRSDLQ